MQKVFVVISYHPDCSRPTKVFASERDANEYIKTHNLPQYCYYGEILGFDVMAVDFVESFTLANPEGNRQG